MFIRCLFLLFLFVPALLTGQPIDSLERSSRKQRRAAAAVAVQHLQEGGLVVRIPTNARQLAALDRLLSDDQLGKGKRQSIQERRDELQQEADSTGHYLVQQFQTYYTLGPLYFVHDSTDIEANSANRNPIFLNEELESDPSISGPGDDQGTSASHYLVLRIAPLQGYARQEGFVISDPAGNELPKPFPAIIGFDSKFFLTKNNKRSARNAQLDGAILRLVKQLNQVVNDFGK